MAKNKFRYFLFVVFLTFRLQFIYAQDTFIEAGIGLGKVAGNKHALGKSELHLNIIKSYKFGQLGLDFSTGGNFIPGSRKIMDNNTEVLSSNDTKFSAVTILYRLSIKKYWFIEPRLGYSTLFTFVHTDDKTKITQSNFTTGIGVGGNINNLTLSLRYQYLGTTSNYSGMRDITIVKSNPEFVSLLLFRVSYRFRLGSSSK